ncbi:MAG: MoaD/ThiS family protein [Syntrophothermus sp.]
MLARLGIPPGEAFVVMVNGRRQDLGWTLKDGDRIGIFPPVGGG